MNDIKVLYLTHSKDDAYRRLNELPFQNDDIKVNVREIITTLRGHYDFYFGAIETNNSLEKIFLKDENKLDIDLILEIIKPLKWDKKNKIVFATHWGGKSLKEYKTFLDKISVSESKIKPGYWGTQAKSYTSNDLNYIKEDIIEFAYPNVYLPLHEAKEIIAAQKTNASYLNSLNDNELKKDINDTLWEIKNLCNSFWQ